MAKQLQLRKGTATEHNTFTGALGEVTVDTTNKTLRVHDGTTAGGTQLATLTGAVVLNNTLTSTSTTQALTAAQGKVLNDQAFGVGQTWQDFTGSRSSGVTYTNTTGKPIMISVIATGRDAAVTIYVGSVLVATQTDIYDATNNASTGSTIVPAGATYTVISTNKWGVNVTSWAELR
jgi:hypothetical protein